jgi:hypothetical protein
MDSTIIRRAEAGSHELEFGEESPDIHSPQTLIFRSKNRSKTSARMKAFGRE